LNFFSDIHTVKIPDFLDILFMSVMIYFVLIWFKKTRAAFVLIGFFIVGGLYLFARQFNLTLTTTVFHSFFTVVLIAVIIIFQEEIRYFFEQVAVWSLNRRIRKGRKLHLPPKEIDMLIRTLFDFSREKIGALIVLRGRDLIARHLEGGIDLNGNLSEPLLKSIFDPHSIGHDGAVIIENNFIVQFSAHLPLSKNFGQLDQGGTRHAAALGLSEKTDALCLIASEERGVVSVARRGNLRAVKNQNELRNILESFYREINPPMQKKFADYIFTENFREKVLAILIAFLLWFVVVYGARPVYKSFYVPVQFRRLASDVELAGYSPQFVKISISGARRNFYFFRKKNLQLIIDASDWTKNTKEATISDSNLVLPQGINLREITPDIIAVDLERKK